MGLELRSSFQIVFESERSLEAGVEANVGGVIGGGVGEDVL